jgi:hypothetical protein
VRPFPASEEYDTAYQRLAFRLLLTALVLCFSSSVVPTVSAAEKSLLAADVSEHPFEPPDTSSPRATLQTFLNEASEGWRFYLEHGHRRPDFKRHPLYRLYLTEIPAVQRKSLGIPVPGVLEGLGIGGIAVALAAPRTIENFFGAIVLYSDCPGGATCDPTRSFH